MKESTVKIRLQKLVPSTIQEWVRWTKTCTATHVEVVSIKIQIHQFPLAQTDCPGHFAHIELARPVYHYGLIEFARRVLRCICFHCSRLLLKDKEKAAEYLHIVNPKTRFNTVFRVCDPVQECKVDHGGCGAKQPKFTKNGLTLNVEHQEGENDRDKKQQLQPEECLRVFNRISSEDLKIMGFNEENAHPSWMIIKNLPVAPPPVRPSVATTARSEDDLTHAYQ